MYFYIEIIVYMLGQIYSWECIPFFIILQFFKLFNIHLKSLIKHPFIYTLDWTSSLHFFCRVDKSVEALNLMLFNKFKYLDKVRAFRQSWCFFLENIFFNFCLPVCKLFCIDNLFPYKTVYSHSYLTNGGINGSFMLGFQEKIQ